MMLQREKNFQKNFQEIKFSRNKIKKSNNY